jgi:hypothetical protein
MSKGVVSAVVEFNVIDAKDLAVLAFHLHCHLYSSTVFGKGAKGLGISTVELDECSANGEVNIALVAVGFEELRTVVNEALEVGEISINKEVGNFPILHKRFGLSLSVELALNHLGNPSSASVADGAGFGCEEAIHVS